MNNKFVKKNKISFYKPNEQKREFLEWWDSIPNEIKIKSKKDQANDTNSIFNNINALLIHIKSTNNHLYNPTFAELKYWLENDVMNFNQK